VLSGTKVGRVYLLCIVDIHVQLNGIVSDEDGGPGPATLAWTVIAKLNELYPARISAPVTAIEPGIYTLQLEAGDGEYTTAETMQIVLYTEFSTWRYLPNLSG